MYYNIVMFCIVRIVWQKRFFRNIKIDFYGKIGQILVLTTSNIIYRLEERLAIGTKPIYILVNQQSL